MDKTSHGRNYYNYSDELYRRLIEDYDKSKTLQIELQPGSHCDLYRCLHCYGYKQKQMQGLIRADKYISILDEIMDFVQVVQLSGVSTEPTTHPDIVEIVRAIKERGFICGLHTKGYRMNQKLRDAFNDDKHPVESYVTFSLDASNSRDYIDIHNISEDSSDRYGNFATDYFNITVNNIKELSKLRRERSSRLRINIIYLLCKQNSTDEKIEEVISLLHDDVDVIRFSFPHTRNDGVNPENYTIDKKKEILERIDKRYQDNSKVRVLTNTYIHSHRTDYKRCYASIFQAVVDKAGNVFPCPQTAVRDYKQLIYGNVKDSSFLEILASTQRQKIFLADIDTELKCRVCDRKDEAVNSRLYKLFYN